MDALGRPDTAAEAVAMAPPSRQAGDTPQPPHLTAARVTRKPRRCVAFDMGWPGPYAAWRTAAMFSVIFTASLTTTPPASITPFQFTPKSRRLIFAVAVKPARSLP